jgi:hypothetical protein
MRQAGALFRFTLRVSVRRRPTGEPIDLLLAGANRRRDRSIREFSGAARKLLCALASAAGDRPKSQRAAMCFTMRFTVASPRPIPVDMLLGPRTYGSKIFF